MRQESSEGWVPRDGPLGPQDSEAAGRGLAGGDSFFSGLALLWRPHDRRAAMALVLLPLASEKSSGKWTEISRFSWDE